VQLAIPFTLAFRSPAHATTPRKRRDTDIDTAASHRGSLDPYVYIDATGIPRGVPNAFKARNQIATGFESVLFWWPAINKNVY
jgi:phosphatidylserine/phosphatidylglycerophosphate/cardiolipin synthase-like enzyme